MAAGIGEAFSKPFLASVFASRPSCLYLNRRQKVYPKLKPFLASDFSLLGWFLGTNIFVETLYSVFACTYKQAELIGLFPSQLNHRQASICMLLRCSKNTGGVLMNKVHQYFCWDVIFEVFGLRHTSKCIQNWSHFWLQISLCWAGSLAPIFLLRRYIPFLPAHTSKQNWLDFSPANWTTDRLRYVCFWDARRTQGGYWNWSTILETFCEADCGVGIRCNGCGPMNASVAGIYCFGSLFWEALGTKRPRFWSLCQVRLLWFSHSNGMWGVCLRFWQDVFGCGIFLPAQLLLTPWSVWALAWQRLGFLNFAFADS